MKPADELPLSGLEELYLLLERLVLLAHLNDLSEVFGSGARGRVLQARALDQTAELGRSALLLDDLLFELAVLLQQGRGQVLLLKRLLLLRVLSGVVDDEDSLCI